MWLTNQLKMFKDVFADLFPSLIEGLTVTLQVTVISVFGVTLLGVIFCAMKLSGVRLVRAAANIYVYCIRGTPFIVQLFLVFFGLPQLIQMSGGDFRINSFWASVVTCSINGGAYITDIFRTSIISVDKGQKEAAFSLEISKFNTYRKIIIPQALRLSISAIGNQIIITFKDTSICSIIALGDIVYKGKLYIGRTMQPFVTYMVIGVFYIIIISILSVAVHCVERGLNNDTENTDKKAKQKL
ncbi:MAG: amino acid ABC transporter permease [Oscillospiraceae bacterium]|nr:amino acid ABC transporter permease [Oscillospiraceae bacterium]